LVSRPSSTHLTGSGYFNRVFYFAEVNAYAGGGTDVARMYDGPWNDTFTGAPGESLMTGDPCFTVAAAVRDLDGGMAGMLGFDVNVRNWTRI